MFSGKGNLSNSWKADVSCKQKTELCAELTALLLLWLYSLCWALAAYLVSRFFIQLVGLFGWMIRPSQGLYQHTEQHKQNKHSCLKWDSKPRSSVRASEESSCLKMPIHVRVWLGEFNSGAGLGYISPHTHEQTPNFARTFQYPE
jgi:hypothetical protein